MSHIPSHPPHHRRGDKPLPQTHLPYRTRPITQGPMLGRELGPTPSVIERHLATFDGRAQRVLNGPNFDHRDATWDSNDTRYSNIPPSGKSSGTRKVSLKQQDSVASDGKGGEEDVDLPKWGSGGNTNGKSGGAAAAVTDDAPLKDESKPVSTPKTRLARYDDKSVRRGETYKTYHSDSEVETTIAVSPRPGHGVRRYSGPRRQPQSYLSRPPLPYMNRVYTHRNSSDRNRGGGHKDPGILARANEYGKSVAVDEREEVVYAVAPPPGHGVRNYPGSAGSEERSRSWYSRERGSTGRPGRAYASTSGSGYEYASERSFEAYGAGSRGLYLHGRDYNDIDLRSRQASLRHSETMQQEADFNLPGYLNKLAPKRKAKSEVHPDQPTEEKETDPEDPVHKALGGNPSHFRRDRSGNYYKAFVLKPRPLPDEDGKTMRDSTDLPIPDRDKPRKLFFSKVDRKTGEERQHHVPTKRYKKVPTLLKIAAGVTRISGGPLPSIGSIKRAEEATAKTKKNGGEVVEALAEEEEAEYVDGDDVAVREREEMLVEEEEEQR